ncbi:aspartyl/asparaginyl beta-hydroxylase domain-containing protein [Roseibium sp.]|uniref:aspartyl/asparaginyl beta-hydroxylase domain-containing protein n=1 Tax=Roseibium sp. TaxID=1936156 RepID=UPI003264539A
MTDWIGGTLDTLNVWRKSEGIPDGALERIVSGLKITGRNEISRYAAPRDPTLFFPGLTAKAWWSPEEFDWSRKVSEALPDMVAELAMAGGVRTGQIQNQFTDGGNWSVLYLTCMGRKDEQGAAAFPATWKALSAVPGATTAGMTYFSAIEGGTHILPHTGFTNGHLRCHLTLASSDECRIRVGDETRTWDPGGLLIFDDTYEHEVWNDSADKRLVLLFDIFHPELEKEETEALKIVFKCYRKHYMRSYWKTVLSPGDAGRQQVSAQT